MRDYGKVSPKFWTGKTGKALRKHPEAQIVALYLMTCPTSEMTGVFDCPLMYVAHETGLGEEGALKGLRRLIEVGFCTYEEEQEVVFVHEMAKFQIGEELKVNDNQVKSVRKAYANMPKGLIRQGFYDRYKDAFHLQPDTKQEPPPKTLRSQEQEQEQEQDQEQNSSVPNGTGGEPPSEPAEKDPEAMTKDELWAAGKSLLEQAGMPSRQCGSFVGKLVKDYGAAIVVEAVRNAVVECPADPVSFLKAACMARKGEGGKTLIPWHATDAGVIAKGVELGFAPNPGETAIQFKARVIAAVENAGKPPAARASPAASIQGDLKKVEVEVDGSPEAKARRSEALKAALRRDERETTPN